MNKLSLTASLFALCSSLTAQAGLIGATIDIDANNGFSSTSICKDGVLIGGTVGAGQELTAANWSGGCVGTYSVDVDDNTVTLAGIESGNYTYADLLLTVTSGETITDASFIGYTDNFFDPFSPSNDTNLVPVVAFTATTLSIFWDGDAAGTGQFVFNGPENGGQAPFGTAVFSIVTDSISVPVAPTIALFGLGLLGLRLRRRT